MNKAAKIATFVAVAVFLFTFVFGGIFNNFLTQGIAFNLENLFLALIGSFIASINAFVIVFIFASVILSISNRDQNFPIKGLQWIFYILGWVTGAFNLVFWFVVFILFAISDKNLPFFNNNLHKRVYYWGILNSIILFLLLPLAMFLVAIPS
jgi:hypothetical protein